jgi:phage terminase large subunit-like protein
MTSTAGHKMTWFHKTKYDYAKKLLNGHIRDDRWFVMIYEPDVQALIEKYGEEWDDEKGLKPWYAYEHVWKETNPAYGVTVKKEYFESEVNMIRNAPENLNAFLRLHLNVFTGTTVEWTIANKWDRLKDVISFSELKGKDCFCGVYTSKPKDLTSICLYFPAQNYMLWKFFAPRPASNLRKTC